VTGVQTCALPISSPLRRVSYGVLVQPGGALEAERVVLARSGYGFFNAGGTLALRRGVIRAQLDAAGAVRTADASARTLLDDVAAVNNATNGVVEDATLPVVSALPTPSSPCIERVCP
jgi:hypothetical protein